MSTNEKCSIFQKAHRFIDLNLTLRAQKRMYLSIRKHLSNKNWIEHLK